MDQTQIYIYIHISLETFRIGSKEELPFWSSSFTTDASLLHSKTTRSPCKPLKPKQGCSSRATDHTCGCRHSPKSRLLVVALPTATCQHADVTQVAAWHRTEVTHFTAQQSWPPCNLVPPPTPPTSQPSGCFMRACIATCLQWWSCFTEFLHLLERH